MHWDRRLEPPELAAAVDEARALVLPSASEGLPRIVIETFVRGRAVIGARAGGIPDIVEDGVNGLLVPAGDVEALAAALERVLTDGELAARLGDGAAASAPKWTATPEQYAERMAALVDETIAAHRSGCRDLLRRLAAGVAASAVPIRSSAAAASSASTKSQGTR